MDNSNTGFWDPLKTLFTATAPFVPTAGSEFMLWGKRGLIRHLATKNGDVCEKRNRKNKEKDL